MYLCTIQTIFHIKFNKKAEIGYANNSTENKITEFTKTSPSKCFKNNVVQKYTPVTPNHK